MLHNVNLEAVEQSATRAQEEPAALRQDVELHGEWQTAAGEPQFRATIPFGDGKVEFRADFPSMLGGGGRAPSPLAFCFWGGLACYAMTFATECARDGVELGALRGTVEAAVDLTRSLGVGTEPPVSEIRWRLVVSADASAETIERLKRQADERCPAVYCIRTPIELVTEVVA